MQWYYARNGQRFGPVEETELAASAQRGELQPADLVWNASMGAWAEARTVPGLFRSAPPSIPAPPPSFPVAGTTPAYRRAAPGTGGQTPNADLMRLARAALSGKWGVAIGFIVLFYIVTMAITLPLSFIPLAPLLVQLLLLGPLTVGTCLFFLTVVRGAEPEIGQMFSGFKRYGASVGAYGLVLLFMMLWSMLVLLPIILLVVVAIMTGGGQVFSQFANGGSPDPATLLAGAGGFIALAAVLYIAAIVALIAIGLRYALVFYIVADDPAAGPTEAVRRSVTLMRGRKWKFFCLQWRFFGWSLLALLTCCIGYLWLMPYMMASFACFYDDVKE